MTGQLRQISVSGAGEVQAAPDLGHVQLGVRVVDRDPDAALNEANERVARIQQALGDAGVASGDMHLGGFSLTTVYDHVDGQRVFRGYQVNHDLSVTAREIDRTGRLIAAGVHAGADDVRGVTFSVEDPSPLVDRARERAFANARHRASELARLASAEVGRIISIREHRHGPVPVERHESRRFALSAQASDVPVSPGDTTFSVTVEAVWEIV